MSADADSDVALVEGAVDAAHVLHDHLTDLFKLTRGEIGGTSDAEQGWRKKLGFDRLGQHSMAKAMGAAYGPDQLHNAGPLADDLAAATDQLAARGHSAIAVQAAADVTALGVHGFGATLRSPEALPEAAAITDLFRQLGRVMATLGEARTKLLLERMRQP